MKIINPSHKYSFVKFEKNKSNLLIDNRACCPHCESSYISLSKLKTHIFEKHTEKTGKCFKCGEKNITNSPYCSRSCANTRKFSKESNLKKANKQIKRTGFLKKSFIETIIFRLNESNNYLYTYPNLNYTNNKGYINIECLDHGEFTHRYSSHLKGSSCPTCFKEKIEKEKKSNSEKKKKVDMERYYKKREDTKLIRIEEKRIKKLNLLKKTRNNKFYYPNFVYNGSNEDIDIICSNNHKFKQKFNNHLRGYNCPECSKEEKLNKIFMTEEEFINKSQEVHGFEKFDYSETEYRRMREKVSIHCNGCNQKFNQLPFSHLMGKGCPTCATSGFKFDKPGRLYYLRIERDGLIVYKIGITNNTVKKRFGAEFEHITIIKEHVFKNGHHAYKLEQKILKKFKEGKYIGDNILASGNTEMFVGDVLGLDPLNM